MSHLDLAGRFRRRPEPEDVEDAIGALASITDEVPKLRDRHARTVAVFAQAGIDTFDTDENIEACVDVLSDEALRARFGVLLKQFLTTLDTVLPRPEALPFVADAKRLGIIQKVARRRPLFSLGRPFAARPGQPSQHLQALALLIMVAREQRPSLGQCVVQPSANLTTPLLVCPNEFVV